jgi:hypothetical protein
MASNKSNVGEIASDEQRAYICAKFAGSKCADCKGDCDKHTPNLAGMMLSHEVGDVVEDVVNVVKNKTPFTLPAPFTLQNAQQRAKDSPATFHAPKLADCKALRVGDMAELFFNGDASVGPGEYIYVQVVAVPSEVTAAAAAAASSSSSESFVGIVTHLVFMLAHPSKHDLIRFQAENVANIVPRENLTDNA